MKSGVVESLVNINLRAQVYFDRVFCEQFLKVFYILFIDIIADFFFKSIDASDTSITHKNELKFIIFEFLIININLLNFLVENLFEIFDYCVFLFLGKNFVKLQISENHNRENIDSFVSKGFKFPLRTFKSVVKISSCVNHFLGTWKCNNWGACENFFKIF